MIVVTKALEELLGAAAAEEERERDAAAAAAQKEKRRNFWTADELEDEEEEEEAAAPVLPLAPLLRDEHLEKAKRDAGKALSENRDLEHVLEALQHYYYGTDKQGRPRHGELPDQLWVVHSGCIPARLMHHPADIDRVAFQSIFASPSFRGHPRYSRVAVEPPDGDEHSVWRGEVRLLFRAYRPDDPTSKEELVLIKYFENFLGSNTEFPPSALTHTFRLEEPAPAEAGGAATEGPRGSSSRGLQEPQAQRVVHEPRRDAAGRYTGAIRVRFAPETRPFTHRYAVMPLSSLIRAEHVLPDFARSGLEGAFDSYYVNAWKWGLESVGDDAGRGQQFQMAPL